MNMKELWGCRFGMFGEGREDEIENCELDVKSSSQKNRKYDRMVFVMNDQKNVSF